MENGGRWRHRLEGDGAARVQIQAPCGHNPNDDRMERRRKIVMGSWTKESTAESVLVDLDGDAV